MSRKTFNPHWGPRSAISFHKRGSNTSWQHRPKIDKFQDPLWKNKIFHVSKIKVSDARIRMIFIILCKTTIQVLVFLPASISSLSCDKVSTAVRYKPQALQVDITTGLSSFSLTLGCFLVLSNALLNRSKY